MPLILPGYHLGIDARRPSEFELNSDSPLATGLRFAGLGRFTKSTRYQDSSLYESNGTLTNMSPSEDWVFDDELERWCLAFDGSDDHVVIQPESSLNPASFITVACWVKANGGGQTGRKPLVLKSYTSHSAPYYQYGLFANNTGGILGLSADLAIGGLRKESPVDTAALETWYHVALTYDGAALRVWRDGTNTVSLTGLSGALNSYATPVWVGAYANLSLTTTYCFLGRIADTCILDRVLTPAEIWDISRPENVMLEVGGVPLIEPISPRYFPVAVAETPTTTSSVLYYHQEKFEKRPAEFELNKDAPLATGLKFAGLGRFTGSTRYQDSSLYESNGTLTNMSPSTDWVFDDELGRWRQDFAAASTQQVVLPISNTLQPTTPFSISAWVKRSGSQSDATGIFQSSGYNEGNGGYLILLFANYVRFYIMQASGLWGYVQSDAAIPDLAWTHIECVYGGTNMGMAINGIVQTDAKASTAPRYDTVITYPAIGRYSGIFFTGSVSDVILASGVGYQDLSRPENVMLEVGGVPLILPPHRMLFPVATTETPVTNSPMAFQVC